MQENLDYNYQLKKAIEIIEKSQLKYKMLKEYSQTIFEKSKQSSFDNGKFMESCRYYMNRWICMVAEANRHNKLIGSCTSLKEKHRLKLVFDCLKYNTKWEKIIKR